MTRVCTLTAAALLATASAASAQLSPQFPAAPGAPYYQPPSVMPNVYNPQFQPLSPYLNLLRGGNPGVNYYYGVRPGTVGGTGQSIGAPFTAPGAQRTPFFPQLTAGNDPNQPREPGEGVVLAPAGHPVTFNNTGGYFPSPAGARGGPRSGLGGLGTARPPQPRR